MTTLPTAVAVSVVMPEVVPIFSVPVAPLVNPPVPDRAAFAVTVPLLVSVTPVTVKVLLKVATAPAPTVMVPVTVVVPVMVMLAVDVNVPATLSVPVLVSVELWVSVPPEFTVTPAVVVAGVTVTVLPLTIVTVSPLAGTQLQVQVALAFQLPITAFDVRAAAIASPLQTPSSDSNKMILTTLFIMLLRDTGIK